MSLIWKDKAGPFGRQIRDKKGEEAGAYWSAATPKKNFGPKGRKQWDRYWFVVSPVDDSLNRFRLEVSCELAKRLRVLLKIKKEKTTNENNKKDCLQKQLFRKKTERRVFL